MGVASLATGLYLFDYKFTISQEWIDGINWLFACWWKFRKTKSYFDDFKKGMVKNRCNHLVHETLKSDEWVYEIKLIFCMLADFDAIILVRSTSYSISLTFNCQSTSVVLVRPLAVAGRTLWNRVCPSFPLDICLCVFLELDH